MIKSIQYQKELFFKWNQNTKIEDIDKNLPIDYKNGQVLSKYKDDIWILNDGFVNININITQVPKTYRNEFKRILFLIYINPHSNKQMIGAKTLYSYSRILLLMFLYAEKNSLSIEDLFTNSMFLYKYIDEIATTSYRAEKSLSILQKLSSINSLEIGFKISLEKQHIKKLKKFIRLEENTQHPIIPPRIYVEIINRLWEEAEFIKKHKKAIIMFYSRIQNEVNFFYGRNACYRIGFKYGTEINHKEAIKQTKITAVFEKYNIKDRNSLTKLITEIQEIIKNLIHAYTGMRRSEVMHLKVGCIEKRKNIYLIHGITTKSSKKIISTYWVATKEIAELIRVQEEFIKIIAINHKLNINDYYLFSSPSLFNL